MFGGTTLHAAHDHAAPEAPGREAPPVEGEVGDPTGLPLIEQRAGIGEVDTSGATAPEAPIAP